MQEDLLNAGKKPDVNVVKANWDAALDPESKRMGLGALS